jgi:hypothetical protein
MEGLAKSLYNAGYDKTERDSPFHDTGTLWKNSHEIICDATGIVIRNTDEYTLDNDNETSTRKNENPRYDNSDRVILPGGMQRVYEWGNSDGKFVYDKKTNS